MAAPVWIHAIRDRDPAGVALRRAIRVALVVPAVMVALLSIPGLVPAAPLFGVFAALALLVFADFGGPAPQRAAAYLVTTAAGVPILWLGITFGQSLVGAVVVMAAVALVLGLLAVLRGMLASAQTTLLLATVLAVTSGPPGSQLQVLFCWTLSGLVATAAAVWLWPAHPNHAIRGGAAGAVRLAADAVRLRWSRAADPRALRETIAALDDQLGRLRRSYVGNLLRPSGLTSADRALAELVDVATRLRRYQRWVDVTPPGTATEPGVADAKARFAASIADELDTVAARMVDHRTPTHPERIHQAREQNLTEVSAWVEDARGRLPGGLVRAQLDDVFPLRLASLSAEVGAVDAAGRADFRDPSLGHALVAPRRGPVARIRAQTSLDSPWFRNALRATVALGLSVGVAKSLALGHEFWIVLGTLTALRFDALGTGRTAAQALLGTTIGVAAASGVILVFADQAGVWWVLLPPTLFLAAFTPGTFSLAVGQASFSLVVLVLFSVLYPATLQTAELRLEEVAIGLCVSLFISLVMWPRGVVATLYQRMRDGMEGATDHLVMAFDYVAGGAVDAPILRHFRLRSAAAMDRAQESYDLSVAQRPPKTVPLREWSRVAVACRHVDVAAHVIPGVRHVVSERGAVQVVPSELVGPLLETAQDMRERLRASVATWADVRTDQPPDDEAEMRPDAALPDPGDETVVLPDSVIGLRASVDTWLETPSDWPGDGDDPRPATATWLADWAAFISWNADLLRRDLARHTP